MSRCIRGIDVTSFIDNLLQTCWDPVYLSVSVAEKWETFLSLFIPVLDQHAPVKRIVLRNPTAPTVSGATKRLMAERRQVLRISGRNSSNYRELNRSVRAAIRKDKRDDIQPRIIEQGPSSVWRNIRSVVQDKKGNQRVVPDISVDSLNEFFCQCLSKSSK